MFLFCQCDNEISEIGKGNIDDLSKLSFLNEELLIQELGVRYKNGQIYVIISSIYLNS